MAVPPTRKQTDRNLGRRSKRMNRQTEVTVAASNVFAAKGYRAASIQDVADRVGVLKGSLYYYIDSKEDLLWWIIDDVHAQSNEILREVLALDAGPIERIRIFIARHVEWYLTHMREVTVFFREWRQLTGPRLVTITERRRAYGQVVRELITAAQDAGDVPADLDVRYAVRYVLAAVNAVPDWYRPSGHDSASLIAGTYAEMTVALLSASRRNGAR